MFCSIGVRARSFAHAVREVDHGLGRLEIGETAERHREPPHCAGRSPALVGLVASRHGNR